MSGPWERYAQAEDGPWKKYGPPSEPPTTLPRLVGQFAQSANDAIVNAGTSIPDLSGSFTKWIGLTDKDTPPISSAYKQAVDDLAGLPLRVRDAVKQGSLDPIFAPRDAYQTRFDPQNRDERIAAGVGQGVGMVASTLLPAGVIAKAAKPGTVGQGVAQQLASQPLTQLASGAAAGGVTGATDDPLLGLAAGLAVPLGVSATRGVISPTTVKLNDAEKRIIEAAKKEGIPLTPSQETGSGTLRRLEETMAKLPLSGGPMNKTYDSQRAALNRAIMARTGTMADDASPATLTGVANTLGQQFDDLAARTTVNLDPKFATDVLTAAQNYSRRLPTDVAPVFKSYVDDLTGAIQAANTPGANPQMSGEVFRTIQSDLARRMRNATSPDLKEALGSLRSALDDAVDRSASPALLKEWQEARRQYAAYKTVDKAMQGGKQAERAASDIPLGSFTNAVRLGDREGFARARGQFGELSKVADYLAPRVPDSGTVTRGVTANLASGGLLAGGAAGLSASMGTAAGAAVAPWALSAAYNTPLVRAYLTNQAAGNTNLRGLYGAEALRRAIEAANDSEKPTALARALMRANEQRAGASR